MFVLLRERWPLLAACALLLTLLGWEVHASTARNGGHFIYPIDDTYIQMTMGRTLAESGVYGLGANHPGTLSSSPLWVVILAGIDKLVGVREVTPMVLAVLSALFLLHALDRWLRANGLRGAGLGTALATAVLVIPLPSLAFLGLEHATHAWIALALALAVTRTCTEAPSGRRDGALCLLAAIACGLRYESAFLAAGAVGLCLVHDRRRSAVALGLGTALPVLVHGWHAWSIGWDFFPSSFLPYVHPLRPAVAEGLTDVLGGRGLRAIWSAHTLVGLVLANALVLILLDGSTVVAKRRRVLQTLVLVTAMLQAQLALFGGALYRYDAWLITLALAALVPAIPLAWAALWGVVPAGDTWSRRRVAAVVLAIVLAAALIVPGSIRASTALRVAPRASNDTWKQHEQLALFCREYLRGRTVAVNDIGAVSYDGQVRILDLGGLADISLARLRADGRLSPAAIDRATRAANADVAIVYDSWFDDGLPSGWTKVAEWHLDDWTHVLDPTLSFYATAPSFVPELSRALVLFAPQLPSGVTVRWMTRPDDHRTR